MSSSAIFLPFSHKHKRDKCWSWEKWLKKAAKKSENDLNTWLSDEFVPCTSFSSLTLKPYIAAINNQFYVEIEHNKDGGLTFETNEKPVWFAKVIKVAGYRLLCRWIGADPATDSRAKSDFWIHIASSEIHRIGECNPMKKKDYVYRPPAFIILKWKADLMGNIAKHVSDLADADTFSNDFERAKQRTATNKFEKGQRVELLSAQNCIRPARITKIKGRRIQLEVREDEYGADAVYWIDEDSFMLFHVGWAFLNKYKLVANHSYIKHAKKIAEAIKEDKKPPYEKIDVRMETILRKKNEKGEFKKGMKLEFFDPLDQKMKYLHVATITKILKNGYLLVQGDDETEDEALPLHWTSPYLFPCGYSAQHNVPIIHPELNESLVTDFDWPAYLKKTNAVAAPEHLFAEFNAKEIARKFPIGSRLEAADNNELMKIYPAIVAGVHGRLLLIHYVQYEEDDDQIYDYSSPVQITNLPGAPSVSFKQYAGYYAVGDSKSDMLHYWFVESQNNPATDPVLVWLTGGPGCSGLSALLTEWGPFTANPDGATLSINPYSWNKKASILTLESPAGVGYSYTTSGFPMTGDNKTATENWEALVAFFQEFPQYVNNDFYVTGESYGGIYVPTLVKTIMDRQSQSKINLKGFAIGNGCVSENEGTDSLVQFLYNHGMIDDTKWQQAKSQCCNNDTDDCAWHSASGSFCREFVESSTNSAWNSGLNPYNMYADCVNTGNNIPLRFILDYRARIGKKPNPLELGTVPCIDETPVTTYLNRQDVRKALQVPTSLPAWSICNDEINMFYNREVSDTTPIFQSALQAGMKVMLYNGDVDMACQFLMGQRFSRKLGIPVKTPAKHFIVDGQVGGYHTQYGDGMHFVSVRGAGHMVPTDKPSVAYHIIDSFLYNNPF
ncbi:hypothetical protein WR25_26417 [Diploscapter pachys]|uniref:Carboxypeptidase n=1 Tax=Diploscapter pachys TaxID=2018661 RepID=A0A2A2KQA2_9BILA|nr:hypothetical protein WR25_26417 [Diploscapter pachys]